MKLPKNIPASVRQRLLNLARDERRPFNQLLQYFAMERFLYRLSQSAHAERFVLKGALMLRVWSAPEIRPTMDIDMLGKSSNDEAIIAAQIRDILSVEVEADGLLFEPDSIQTERITEDAEYEGIRIKFRGKLDTAIVALQLDIGFGDVVYPEARTSKLPTMLGFPPAMLLCYSRESSVAEKFEAMVKLGLLNSRMKDFYDIWLLSRNYDFDGAKLSEAVKLTFEHRGTVLPQQIDAFSESFIHSKQIQWEAFRRRFKKGQAPESFKAVVNAVDEFISPVVCGIPVDKITQKRWKAPGPWA
jgi:predicted nucleotidyltransferase component of viral defense system